MQQEVLFQKYKILSLLGSGGTAKVYLAEHIKLNSYRAIKFISKNHPLYHLQHKEAFILKNLKHSCIPIIYDIEEDEDGSYIVEQYLEGDTLKDYIATKGPLQENIIILFGLQLCDLILYLHSIERPVIYVDLKPDNIILSGDTLKLVDFGSALYQDELSEKQDYYGTRGYAAPELFGHTRIDERCDVYGIGMLLYYMSTGRTISKEESGVDNIDITAKCSEKLKNIINRCLKFNPSQRFADVTELSRQLSVILKKNHFQGESSQVLKIAVAGSQSRCGVTHLSFRLCNYFIHQKLRCLYLEMNNSGCVRTIINRYEDVPVKDGIYEMNEILMMGHQRQSDWRVLEGYQVIVQDFGCLTKDNLPDFLKAEIKLLILGAKDWELACAEQILNMVAEYKEIAYLFNFLNGRQFLKIMRSMDKQKGYRIPYEPDPFADITPKNGLEFFQELIPPVRKPTFKEKAANLMMKGRQYETKTNAISKNQSE